MSRAKSIAGFLVLRLATREELSARPPQYLLDELERLEGLEEKTLEELVRYLELLGVDMPQFIRDYVLAKDGAAQERRLVSEKRMQTPTVAARPKKRLTSKTTVVVEPVSKSARLESDESLAAEGANCSAKEPESNEVGWKRVRMYLLHLG